MPDQHRIKAPVRDGPPPHPETQEVFYRLFEFAPDAIVVVDQQGVIRRANAKTEQMFGYRREELVGQPVEVLIPQRFARRHVEYRGKYLDNPRTRPMGASQELFARRKDGSEFPVDIMLSPLDTSEGKVVLAVVRHITGRKKIEAQRRKARRSSSACLSSPPTPSWSWTSRASSAGPTPRPRRCSATAGKN